MASKVDDIRERAGLGLARPEDVNFLLDEIDRLTPKPEAPAAAVAPDAPDAGAQAQKEA